MGLYYIIGVFYAWCTSYLLYMDWYADSNNILQ